MRLAFTDKCQWNPWFAWYPVTVDGAFVWLERVERRWDRNANICLIHPDDHGYPAGAWEYRNAE